MRKGRCNQKWIFWISFEDFHSIDGICIQLENISCFHQFGRFQLVWEGTNFAVVSQHFDSFVACSVPDYIFLGVDTQAQGLIESVKVVLL